MIEISSQMREFVNFAQDAVANNAKNSIARLGKQESRYSAFAISAATDGDSVGKLRRSAASKDANNTVRTKFRDAVAQMFGGADNIPRDVLSAMNMKDYAKGKPLTADRILDVYAAIKKYISGQKNAALENGTLKALDVADSVADQFVENFKTKCKTPPSAAVVSNLKRMLLLCAASSLDDNAVKGGNEAVMKFAKDLNNAFKYTFKVLGFDTATHTASNQRVKDLLKDELHMRRAVFALLNKDGIVDVNNFEARLKVFDDEWLKGNAVGLLRPNIESPTPKAVKALQSEFTRTARVKVADMARSEVDAFFKAHPDKIPAALRNDKREAGLYVGLVQKYVTSKGENEAGARLAAGDANAKIDVASALKEFNTFMESIYAATNGDKDLRRLVEQFSRDIAINGAGELRSIEDIKKKFIEPVRANLEELRAAADGNAAILKAGMDAIAQSQMKPFKKGVITSLVNGAKNLGQAVLKSISERSTSYEIAKAFADVFAKFRKLMPDENYNDQFDRAERNAYLLLFAGVAMAGLNQGEKERMSMIFATDASKIASNTMQALVQDSGMDPVAKTSMQDMAHMMRECTTFLADDLAIDADVFAVNHDVESMTFETIPADVAAKFTDLVKEMQG